MRSRMPSLRSLKRSGSPAPPPRSNTPPLDYDPIRRSRQWDLQQLVAVASRPRSRRFLGSGRRIRTIRFSPRRPPIISAAAQADRRDRAGVARRAESVGQAARAAAERRRARRFTWPPLTCCCWKRTRIATIKLGVQATADAAKQGAPTERVALFVRDARAESTGRASFSIWPTQRPMATTDGRLDSRCRPRRCIGRGPQLEAVALLRTNAFTTPFLLRETGGARIDFKPYHYGPPTVTLAGRSRKRASIIFILDCSNSMTELTDMEGPGGVQRIPRIEAAKIALHDMLSQLAAEGDARVGVMFYGHRVGWNLKKPDQMLRQTDYARPIPDDLRPERRRRDGAAAWAVRFRRGRWGVRPDEDAQAVGRDAALSLGHSGHRPVFDRRAGHREEHRRHHRRRELSIQFAESQSGATT